MKIKTFIKVKGKYETERINISKVVDYNANGKSISFYTIEDGREYPNTIEFGSEEEVKQVLEELDKLLVVATVGNNKEEGNDFTPPNNELTNEQKDIIIELNKLDGTCLLTELNLVRAFVEPFYKLNDSAHGISHADYVYQHAMQIKEGLNLDVDDRHIIYAAYFHDIYSTVQRKAHHVFAHDFIKYTKSGIFDNFLKHERDLIAKATLEHRASYDGEFTSLLSQVISAADRGEPNFKYIAQRVYECSCDDRTEFVCDERANEHEDNPLARTYHHLKEKYGRGGYANYNEVYLEYYAKELKDMQDKIEVMSFETLKLTLKIAHIEITIKSGERSGKDIANVSRDVYETIKQNNIPTFHLDVIVDENMNEGTIVFDVKED
jgi:HD superfamily phosphodiesterase